MQRAAWESCWTSARARVNVRDGWLSDDKAEGFRNWMQMDVDAQMLFMATYTLDSTSITVTPQIMDLWRTTAPRTVSVKVVDTDGYQTVSGKKQAAAAVGEISFPDDGQL